MQMETSNHSEHKENQQITSPQEKNETVCFKPEAPDSRNEIRVEPHNLDRCTVMSPPSCESEPHSAPNSDEKDEDQTIFFTPELFEGEYEGSPQKDMTADSPPMMKSAAPLPEELFEQGQGQASAVDVQSATSVRKDDTEVSLGQKEAEEGEQVDNQSRQTDSRLRKLSGSREKAPSTQTGN